MKKIMFNDRFGLTKAVLEGRKTQTRRIMPHCTAIIMQGRKNFLVSSHYTAEEIAKDLAEFGSIHSPYKVGDILAIAQSYKDIGCKNDSPISNTAGWNNKMFVRSGLMPHHTKIEQVRVERLQDISDMDCKREGIVEAYRGCYWLDGFYHTGDLPQIVYRELIDKISGKGTWDKNPFVFVYDFSLID